jgi:hypothetical protein
VETPDEWIGRGPIGEGESQSIRVEHQNTGTMGVAKPGRAVVRDTVCRAAHVKIAFDLAHCLDLPVRPVVLWARDIGAIYLRGRSISAWAFPQAKKWDEAQRLGFMTPALLASAGPVVSGMRVFHTWISDTDRKSDHTQGGGIGGEDTADDEPIEQHADGGEVLLDGRLRAEIKHFESLSP